MKIKIKFRRTSAEIVASIDDLLTEILLRLPMKSLIRFKLVSKHWHSLIANPHFCLLRNPSPNPAAGLFLHYSNFRARPTYEYVSFSLNKSTNSPFGQLCFTEDPSGIGVLQSCNGLLLCSSFKARHNYNSRFYIYNPTTRRFSKLPKLNQTSRVSARIHGMSLAFDPAKCPQYKVVCVIGFKSGSGQYRYQFEVYSSATGPWRKYGEPFTAQSVNFEKAVYWNGALHWISSGGGDSLYLNLDDDDRRAQIMPMPPIPNGWDWRSNYYLGESCDHLHYIEFLGGQIQLSVYELKRDYSEWFVKYNVNLSPVVATYPAMIRDNFDPVDWYYYAFSIFTLVRADKEEGSFLVLQIPGKVVRYNLVCGAFETIYEFEGADVEASEGCLRYQNGNSFQYIESLCCV